MWCVFIKIEKESTRTLGRRASGWGWGELERGRTFEKVETRSILFKQQKKISHTHFFPAGNSSKILPKKFVWELCL